ncbi:hypothetical protein BJ741DRAFT_608063, partial [Chytriomyces cf. hyalinus JEL632]
MRRRTCVGVCVCVLLGCDVDVMWDGGMWGWSQGVSQSLCLSLACLSKLTFFTFWLSRKERTNGL